MKLCWTMIWNENSKHNLAEISPTVTEKRKGNTNLFQTTSSNQNNVPVCCFTWWWMPSSILSPPTFTSHDEIYFRQQTHVFYAECLSAFMVVYKNYFHLNLPFPCNYSHNHNNNIFTFSSFLFLSIVFLLCLRGELKSGAQHDFSLHNKFFLASSSLASSLSVSLILSLLLLLLWFWILLLLLLLWLTDVVVWINVMWCGQVFTCKRKQMWWWRQQSSRGA